MRPSALLLRAEAEALGGILERTPEDAFALPTICIGWSVRDVMAHCSAALAATATGHLHRFTPDDNQRDVDERKEWPLVQVIEELRSSYEAAALAVDAAEGRYDGIAIGEWVHGGDIRSALGEPGAYASSGVEIALDLLLERSRTLAKPEIEIALPSGAFTFGAPHTGLPPGSLRTDIETFVRLCGGRAPDPARYSLAGADPADLVLFS